MSFGRGHAAYTIDTLNLAKDSLPTTVTEPPPVFPELLNRPLPLNEDPNREYEYKLQLKSNFVSNFRNLHDPKNENFRLNRFDEEWSILPRELKQFSRMKKSTSKFKPKIAGKNPSKAKAKKNAESILENLNKIGEKLEDGEEKNDENEADEEENEKTVKKALNEDENEVEENLEEEDEEEIDYDEGADYFESHFDPGDRDDDDLDDDGADGID